MFVIFDLDGTLSLADHRRHFLDSKPPNWDAFYAACDQDAPNVPIIEALRAHELAGDEVQIWSGRRDSEHDKTVAWFKLHNIHGNYSRLRMRPHKDHRPDEKLKGEWLDECLAAGLKPDLVYDDRDRMVAMWRSRGIVCAQVAPGNF